MSALSAVLLLVAIAGEVTGTLALRQSAGLRRPGWVLVTVTAYLAAFTCLAVVLHRGVPVGVAYGVWAALGIVLTAVAGRVLLREPLTATMAAGIAVIIAGVVLVELG